MARTRDKPLSDLVIFLDLVRNISFLGILVCVMVLAYDRTAFSIVEITVYAVWFLISILSVWLMKRADIWGAYALAIATALVTIFDLIQNRATLGGALLGGGVFLILLFYIRRHKKLIEAYAPIPL